jgi:hypothetical protein
MSERRGHALVDIRLAYVGPHVDRTASGLEFPGQPIVLPDPFAGFILGSEPTLVADEDLALHGVRGLGCDWDWSGRWGCGNCGRDEKECETEKSGNQTI